MTNLDAVTGFDWTPATRERTPGMRSWIPRPDQVFFGRPAGGCGVARSLDEPRFHASARPGWPWAGCDVHAAADDTRIRVISARDMNRKERSIYERTTEEASKVPQ